MKTREMIKELTENPKKVFMRDYDELVIKVDKTTETLSWESGHEHLCIDDEWVEVKQPITWQEAIQALVDGKDIDLVLYGTTIRLSKESNKLLVYGAEKGVWYINE